MRHFLKLSLGSLLGFFGVFSSEMLFATGKVDLGKQFWLEGSVQSASEFNYIEFTNELNGYAVSESSLFNTTDGGKTWTLTDTFGDAKHYADILGVIANDEQVSINVAITEKDDVEKRKLAFYTKNLKTGAIVESVYDNDVQNISIVSPFVKSGNFIAYEYDEGFRLSNDGVNWQEIPAAPGHTWIGYSPDFSLRPDGTITAVRHQKTYLEATNLDQQDSQYCVYSQFNQRWSCEDVLHSFYATTSFVDNKNGIFLNLVGGHLQSWPLEKSKYSGPIFYTSDAGAHWKEAKTEKYVICTEAYFVTESYIVGACQRIVTNNISTSLVYSSKDGGQTWAEELSYDSPFMPTIKVVDKKYLKEVVVEFEYWPEGEKHSKVQSYTRSIPVGS